MSVISRAAVGVVIVSASLLPTTSMAAPSGADDGILQSPPPAQTRLSVAHDGPRPAAKGSDGYWTLERLRSAKPLDPTTDAPPPSAARTAPNDGGASHGVVLSHPVAPRKSPNTLQSIPGAAGRLFAVDQQGRRVSCSASVVSNQYRNLVVTAAHCVHPGPGQNWYTNIAFAPGWNGNTPYGLWTYKQARVPFQWLISKDWGHDQAFVSMWPNASGSNLVDVVGANGMKVNLTRFQRWARILGWPAESPYDGNSMKTCEGSTFPTLVTSDAAMSCPLTHGASGGPWLIDFVDNDLAYTWAVTSRATEVGPHLLMATPFDWVTENLYREMN